MKCAHHFGQRMCGKYYHVACVAKLDRSVLIDSDSGRWGAWGWMFAGGGLKLRVGERLTPALGGGVTTSHAAPT